MTFEAVIAALLFGVAAGSALAPGPRGAVRRLGAAAPSLTSRRRDLTWPGCFAGAGVLCVAAFLLDGGRGTAVAVCVSFLGLTAIRLVRSSRRDRRRHHRRMSVAQAGEVLAGMLRLGHVPARALDWAAGECDAFKDAAEAQAVGGDVPQVLSRAASVPGYEDLSQVAAGWQVATAAGAPMVSTMEAVSARLRADRQLSDIVQAELSASRATGRLLAALPVAGLLLGYAVGADPLVFLTGGLVGQACLVAGVGLMCAGLWWTDSLAGKAGEQR